MKKKLAIFALGSCLSLGTAAICAAQTDQNSNPNQTTTTQPQSTTTNGQNSQNSANNPNSPNYNPNSATNPNANPNYNATNPNATNPNVTNPNVTNPNATGTANRMPATDANWLGMLLGGGGLSFLGMRLRKFARR